MVPELWSLTVKLVVAECAPAVCGMNVYVNAHDAPDANVMPWQFCTPVKLGSPGTPPATVNVCGVDDLFMTTTSCPADESPSAVAGNVNEVGTMEKVSVVPDRKIVPELWPLIVKLVVAECMPEVCGMNVYVNAHVAFWASVAPWQVWNPSKFTSPGAPPAAEIVCVVFARFVTTTSIPADVPPTAVVGNAKVVGAIENPGVAVPDNGIYPQGLRWAHPRSFNHLCLGVCCASISRGREGRLAAAPLCPQRSPGAWSQPPLSVIGQLHNCRCVRIEYIYGSLY